MSPELAIEAHGLAKRFGESVAVDEVSIEVEVGAVRGLLGRNGAGKTTLFRILFGLLAPDSGSLRLLGRDAEPGDVHARRGVAGFVEEARFYPYLSARRNLELLSRLDGMPSANGINDALEAVGLAGRSEKRAGNFSTGMRQRLGLAAALVRKPRLLLLDEPTIGLDPSGARTVRTLVRELAARGVTVFLSSHNMVEVDEICDSVVIIDQGRVVWDGTLERLRNEAPAPLYHLSTSDDRRAVTVALGQAEIEVARSANRQLSLRGEDNARDEYVVALAHEGVAVRRLEPAISPLEALFAGLTRDVA